MQTQSVENPAMGSKHSGESGFTTIEMFVAMMLFAIVIGSIYGLLEIGRSARFNSLQSAETSQDVRVGLNTIGKDVLNAGVDYPNVGPLLPNGWLKNKLLIPPDPLSTGNNLTPVIAGYQLNTLVNTSVSPSVTVKTDQVTLISTDNTFNGGLPLNIVNMNASSQQLVISPQITPPATKAQDNTVVNIGDLLFVNSALLGNGVICEVTDKGSNGRANNVIRVGPDPLGLNDLSSPTGNMGRVGNPAGAQRIGMVTYHVVDDGSGQGTGVLMRTVYGGADSNGNAVASTDQPLTFDVIAMNIRYTLQDSTVISNPVDSQFPNIRQLSITLSVRSPKRDPKTNQPIIDTVTSTFNARNLGYEKN
jgi:hypothetical protein